MANEVIYEGARYTVLGRERTSDATLLKLASRNSIGSPFTARADDCTPVTGMDATIDAIARQHLNLETLETRNSDSLDFHEQAVWSIKAALEAAYRAGAEAAERARPPRLGIGPATVSTAEYESSHGRKPTGRGAWAFEIAGETVWIPGVKLYSDARREAVKLARERGVDRIKVCT